jgi:beta-N-acetylhexosaminidase
MANGIGQHVMIGFDGKESSPGLRSLIRDEGIGGIILFRRNIESKNQVRRMVDRLQEEAVAPLVVAIDQEGGRVQRLPRSFGQFPSMAEVGRQAVERDDPSVAYAAGERIARVLKPLGVNLNFAPVLDVATNPFNPVIGDRSFGHDADFVAQLGVQFIRGIMQGGVGACGKHFPGHGDTDADSHLELPLITHTKRRFEVCEWKPFREAIDEGVPAMMTAHVMAPNLDRGEPATTSHHITSDLLRGELGFSGVVFTDDLAMEGIRCLMPEGEAAVRAIRAGADMVIISEDVKRLQRVLDVLKKAADAGYISERHLTQSSTRIQNLKNSLINEG